jgi:hypothetical protein
MITVRGDLLFVHQRRRVWCDGQEPGLTHLADALHRMQHVQSAGKVCEVGGYPARSARATKSGGVQWLRQPAIMHRPQSRASAVPRSERAIRAEW